MLEQIKTLSDPVLFDLLEKHKEFMESVLPMIASESYTRPEVIAAQFFGHELDDETLAKVIELAEERCKKAFDRSGEKELWTDITAPSGAAINMSVLARMMDEGENIRMLAPDLKYGYGHLTHGAGEEHFQLRTVFALEERDLFLHILGEYGFEYVDTRRPKEERIQEILDAHEAGTVAESFSQHEAGWFLQMKAARTFLAELYNRDREKYKELFGKCEKLAEATGLPNLSGIPNPGNPTAINQIHDVQGYRALETGEMDYDQIAESLKSADPPFDVIILGGSANPRDIDYEKVIDAAKESNTIVWLDCAHYTGLIAGGVMSDPILAGVDIITTTTHKSPQGVKGSAMILNRENLIAKHDKGNEKAGFLLDSCDDDSFKFDMDSSAASAHAAMWKALGPNDKPEKKEDSKSKKKKEDEEPTANEINAKKILENSRALAEAFSNLGGEVITGGTDSHIVLLNAKKTYGLNGDVVAKLCEEAGIIINKNGVPDDTGSAFYPDGVRLGTVYLTALGATPATMGRIAVLIDQKVRHYMEENEIDHRRHIGGEACAIIDQIQLSTSEILRDLERPDQGFDQLESFLRSDEQLTELLEGNIESALSNIMAHVQHLVQTALQTKYAEGYVPEDDGPSKRFYRGNKFIDELETRGQNIFLKLAQTFGWGKDRYMQANTQSPSPEMALLAVLRSVAKTGDPVYIMKDSRRGGSGIVDAEYEVDYFTPDESIDYKWDEAKDLIGIIEQDCPRVMVLSTTLNLSKKNWAKLKKTAEENDTLLVCDNVGDLKRIISGETINPLNDEYVDIMITNAQDVGGPKNSAAILWDQNAIQGQIPLSERTSSDDINFSVFPATIGGPDLVSMVQMYVAAASALRMYSSITEIGH